MRNNELFKKKKNPSDSTTQEPRQEELDDWCVHGGLGADTEYLSGTGPCPGPHCRQMVQSAGKLG